jgi:NitT/TauT family transport system substrate-binding protein
VIAPNLSAEERNRYYEAENKAANPINTDFYKYAHHVAAHTKGALEPTELLRAFVRYKHVHFYDQALFGCAYDWMKAHGFSNGQSAHSSLII